MQKIYIKINYVKNMIIINQLNEDEIDNIKINNGYRLYFNDYHHEFNKKSVYIISIIIF